MMRKIKLFTIATLLFIFMISLIGCGGDSKCLEYTLLDDGTYAVGLKDEYNIIYSGEIVEDSEWHQVSFSGGDISGKKYEKVEENIVIPETYQGVAVTAIKDFGFNNYKIKSVTLPNSIKKLGKGAFYCCVADVNIPEGIEIISDYAFYSCNMENIILPNGIKEIGKYAFSSNNINTIILPEGLEKIGDCAFSNCGNLKDVLIPASVKELGEYIFYNYNYHKLPALTNVESIFYKGNDSLWKEIVKTDKSIDANITIYNYCEDANVFDYLKAEENGKKIWSYNSNNKPELVSFTVTNTVENKTYVYENTEVVISDDYWNMLEEAKNAGMLEQVLDSETLVIYNNSIDKESFQANILINFQEKYQLKYEVSFSGGKVSTYYLGEQITIALEYVEVDANEIYYSMSEKLAYTIKNGKLYEDLSNEYIKVVHYFVQK